MKTETQEWIDDTSEQLDIDETNKEPAVTWLRLKIRQAIEYLKDIDKLRKRIDKLEAENRDLRKAMK